MYHTEYDVRTYETYMEFPQYCAYSSTWYISFPSLSFFSLSMYLGGTACARRACRIQYDGMALHCLLSLLCITM